MASFDQSLVSHIQRIQMRDVERDQRMNAARLVRTGYAHVLFKDLFPADWPRPVIANTIDVIAQDVAEQVGVLPTFSAAGDSILEDSGRRKADKLTKIINYYVWASRIGSKLIQAADRFTTYGFLPVRVEPNWDEKRPHIVLDDPYGAYFDNNRYGDTVMYIRMFNRRASELARLYPEYAHMIMPHENVRDFTGNDPFVNLAKVYDGDSTKIVILRGENEGLILSELDNPLGRVPVKIAQRPSLDGESRGAFDDVLWVFAARAKLALLALEATQKAVEAPIALPQDVQELAFGPDAILRSATPERIRRIQLDLPQSSIIENQMLDNEIKFGARFPEARAGQTDASVVTGRGVQALMSGFDARVKTSQLVLGEALNDALSMALEMDEKIWGDKPKEISSVTNGTPYSLKYTPSKDIKGEYAVNYEYGVMAGLDPNKALVWGLQGLGAGLFSKGFLRRNLPVSMDVQEEERAIDVERLRDASLGAVEALSQAIPQIASQGGDPTQIIQIMGTLIEDRKKGTQIEKAIANAFTPKQPASAPTPPPGEAAGPQDPMSGPPGLPGEGGSPVDIEQAQPIPTMQQLLAQLSGSGRADTSVRTVAQRRV